MDLSIFEVLGPVMIGPSSSHTAGAARLARAAAEIAARPFFRVEFALHGSFLKTGEGHGTRLALLAGAMGIGEEDERLRDAEQLARENGIDYRFTELEAEDMPENTVRIRFDHMDGTESNILGSSIGGGRICIRAIDGMPTEVYGDAPTLIIRQDDVKGVVSSITTLLARAGINIAVMRVGRQAKGMQAFTVLELDEPVPRQLLPELRALPGIRQVCVLQL